MRLFLGSFATINYYGLIKEKFSFLEGKWVEKHNIHLTYLFLGDMPTPQPIIERLEDIAKPEKKIGMNHLGFFGHPPKVLFAKASDESLFRLHQAIVSKLQIKPDKAFIPHVTLCRIKKVHNFDRFIQNIRFLEGKAIGSIEPQLRLIKSILTPKGPVYKIIHTF
ncbi:MULTISPECIES: RNA 2',3'-cyclic phosphodiesterase [unclassified Nitratiruptor]|uniref:RNA 2',3'-cyclic phosphodiesterase n=1 Tax=unclassified Nitratiruptor TaxID=2624044 RepID=UPI00191690E4|nr:MULTISPECIES: RNA 2',3'-cyclic phosphodiesterase [unclassified Nitratiruptor]BCD60893.1 RNA 2',3'-cyclic 3'-phosphodiesterase [Nitratiruptor sp. YY08-10]BCD64825.1 RNA 2',3'-cyclic 3'-phosphodiesterase [Nitratiruptor sp. YY08-14]